jgi:hypothetical protein
MNHETMAHEIAPSETRALTPDGDLAVLAQRANEAHERVASSLQQAVAHALEAGRALLEARAICSGGKFTSWLKANFGGAPSTARGYMRLVANWDQLGGDLKQAGALSQRQLRGLIKGLPCSDGRANPHRPAARQLAAPADAMHAAGQPSVGQPSADDPAGDPDNADGSDPLEMVGWLLEQAVAELRRLTEACSSEASYARHLLQPLESICLGIPTRKWLRNLPRN